MKKYYILADMNVEKFLKEFDDNEEPVITRFESEAMKFDSYVEAYVACDGLIYLDVLERGDETEDDNEEKCREGCCSCEHYGSDWDEITYNHYEFCLKGHDNLKGFPFKHQAKCYE